MPYATVLLPLALPRALTYVLPEQLAATVKVGARVVVPLGARRFYTGIVVRLQEENPEPELRLKEVADVLEGGEAIVDVRQLQLWRWMADYYLCTPGEVMKAALPSGLKLESETLLVRNADFCEDPDQPLSQRERDLIDALSPQRGRAVEAIERETHQRGLLAVARRLMEKGAVMVHENMAQAFKPRTETHVRLASDLLTNEALHQALDTLHRAPAQEEMLLTLIRLSHADAAITLGNPTVMSEVAKRTLLDQCKGGESAFSALRRRGMVEAYAVQVDRLRTQQQVEGIAHRPLNDEQQKAADAIRQSFAHQRVCLLHGVTSSGKTEVYMHLIEEVLSRGEQVLYLVPEIALTTQLTSRLGRVFGERMGVYHSKFPDAERVELWQRQLSPRAFPLILGVRSSIFLPFRKLGLIIVDEEHEASYKQQDPAPRYNARDAAVVLGCLTGARVLLGTATPSLETYHNATTGKYGLVRMLHRFGNVQMPHIEVENVKELRRTKQMRTPFSPRLTKEVRQALADGEQAILFQNRRGYSPVLECRTCGWTPRCTHCDVSLTFHQRINKLVCHYCGTAYDVPHQCPACGDTDLRDLGYGTEKIESAAQAVFPEAQTARMDLDTTRTRTAYEKLITDFQQNKTNLLVGTQMVTKGLDFDHVRVVGILNADQMLNLPDFRAHERAFQMMSQVAGRAGRRDRQGLVVLQTRQPDLPVVGQVVRGDYEAMYRDQMEEREAFHFPPVYRLVNVSFKHRDEDVAAHASEMYASMLRPHFGADLLGPDRPVVSRVQSLHLRKLMVKIRPGLPSQGVRHTLLAARDLLLQQQGMKSLHVVFDVDPL